MINRSQATSHLAAARHRLARYARIVASREGLERIVAALRRNAGRSLSSVLQLPHRVRSLIQVEETADPLLLPRREIARIVRGQIKAWHALAEVVCIGEPDHIVEIEATAAALPCKLQPVRIIDPGAPTWAHDFNVALPSTSRRVPSTLVIYTTAGFLGRWSRVEEDLDRYFLADGRKRVILVFCTQDFRPLDIPGHAYLLSILMSNFPTRKFETDLDVYVKPERAPARERPLVRSLRLLWADARHELGLRSQSGLPRESPCEFSAFVISVRPRRRATDQ